MHQAAQEQGAMRAQLLEEEATRKLKENHEATRVMRQVAYSFIFCFLFLLLRISFAFIFPSPSFENQRMLIHAYDAADRGLRL